MLGATKSWREKLKCSFFHSQGYQLRQTCAARGRLIAVEIEFESRFSPWIRNSRLVFKMMCRCFQIWQGEKKRLDGEQTKFCIFLPQVWNILLKISILDEFHALVRLCSECQLAESHFLLSEFKDLLMSQISLCFSRSKNTQLFCFSFLFLHSARVASSLFFSSSSSSGRSSWAKQVSGLPHNCRCQDWSARHIKEIKDSEINS